MNYEWHDLLGNLGVLLILGSYLLLQLQRISATSRSYSAVNAVGALCIVISLTREFNLSAFVIEFAWFLISVYGYAAARRREAAARAEG